MSMATINALSQRMTNRELAELFNCSEVSIMNIKKRKDKGEVDKELIAELGFKLCSCCKHRVVGEDLRMLCPICYRYRDQELFDEYKLS